MEEVDERKRKLEEKRKKVAELRAKRAAMQKEQGEMSAADVLKHKHNEVDNLLASIETTLPAKQTPTETAVETKAAPQTSPNLIQSRTIKLTHCHPSSSIVDIPPEVREEYNKETQTTESFLEDEAQKQTTEVAPVVKFAEQTTVAEIHAHDEMELPDEGSNNNTANSKEAESAPAELTLQERRQIIESPEFLSFFDSSSKLIERALGHQFDVLVNYGAENDNDTSEKTERVSLQCKLFDDRWSRHRLVSDVSWSSKHNDLLLAAYSASEVVTNDPEGVVLAWSLAMRQRPEHTFTHQAPILKAQFLPFSPQLVVGTTYTGQIVLWDIRAKQSPVQKTPLSTSTHTHPVYALATVGTENAHSIVTVSTDGRLCVWPSDNLSQPQEILSLATKSKGVPVTSLCFPESDGGVNGFCVGGEDGSIHMGYRHGTNSGIAQTVAGHYGSVTALDAHPSFPATGTDFSDLILSASIDWTVKLWSTKNMETPLETIEAARDYVFDAKWSPTNPALFATGDGEGFMSIWSLVSDLEKPMYQVLASDGAVNCVNWSRDGLRLATGDSKGQISVFNVNPEMATLGGDAAWRLEECVRMMRAQTRHNQTHSVF
eukprot:GCRY01002860.1.p1 GENE.GCRY01002860.1~~GCRY01002860.1.p1  ORF type:complete len:602 (+),score=127.77 GCRY01002860.1:214-2019(+)